MLIVWQSWYAFGRPLLMAACKTKEIEIILLRDITSYILARSE
jgi:hypothetical protein